MRRLFAFALGLAAVSLFTCSLPAHEIKALASTLMVTEAGGKTTVYLSWGHRLPVDDLVDAATLERFELLDPAGKATALKAADKALQTNVVELPAAGVYQVAVARKVSLYSYVVDEDGTRQLKRGGKSAHAGANLAEATKSQQCAKALIVVGKAPEQAPAAAGLPVEIVPLDAPARWASNTALRFRVLLDGKPLTGAEVVARPVGFKPDNAWSYATASDRKGEFSLVASRAGTWVLKAQVKRLVQGKAREEHDFESYTATLTLEIAP